MPAERELAERFETSRTSVREAVRALENFGVVEVRRGAEGVRICNTPREAFAELMRFHVALGHYRPAEVVEVRAALEANAVATVASVGDAEVLGELAAIATAMDADRIDARRSTSSTSASTTGSCRRPAMSSPPCCTAAAGP
ncbi:MAG TPA: GntR family transcriptional regulator [Solirubrobacterales bacterium]|nr:GntR family transcriptional regulator [Solirubrobacterales bacterium]